MAIALLMAIVVLGSSSAFAQNTGNATIDVTGTIVGPTCSLTTSNITLAIGLVDESVLANVGDTSNWSPAESLLWGPCDASLVTLTFTGAADANNPALFAVTGGAAGVGIQLQHTYLEQAVYKPGDEASETPTADFHWTFQARYMRTSAQLTPGPGNATITVLVTYT
ncbi:fimbrial protein [Dyella humi]|uniref:Fimbrial protein n=1 Tax=Dyella humi TaxID=1770547 RepID=A0ABW8IFK1_9GAMM